MRKATVAIIERSDLNDRFKDISIEELKFEHLCSRLKFSEHMQMETLVLFIDNGGETKILKNRWGDRGEALFTNYVNNLFDSEELKIEKVEFK